MYSLLSAPLYFLPASRVLSCTRLDQWLRTVPIASQRGLGQMETELREDPYTHNEKHAIEEGVSLAYRRLLLMLVSAPFHPIPLVSSHPPPSVYLNNECLEYTGNTGCLGGKTSRN